MSSRPIHTPTLRVAEGAAAVADYVRVSASLTEVLAFALIHTAPPPRTTRCANEHATLASLSVPSSLPSQLNLGYNSIGPEGGKAIGEALKVNASLTKIECAAQSLAPNSNEPAILPLACMLLTNTHEVTAPRRRCSARHSPRAQALIKRKRLYGGEAAGQRWR